MTLQERPDNDVNSIMLAAVKRLNRDKDDDRIYQVDRDEKDVVAHLEMFEQVRHNTYFVSYLVCPHTRAYHPVAGADSLVD